MKTKIILGLLGCFSFLYKSFSQAKLIQEKTFEWQADSSKWFDDEIVLYQYDDDAFFGEEGISRMGYVYFALAIFRIIPEIQMGVLSKSNITNGTV